MKEGEGGQAIAFVMRYWFLHFCFIRCDFVRGRLKKVIMNMKKSHKKLQISKFTVSAWHI